MHEYTAAGADGRWGLYIVTVVVVVVVVVVAAPLPPRQRPNFEVLYKILLFRNHYSLENTLQ